MKKEAVRPAYLLLQKQKGEMQELIVSHLSLWLSHEKNTMGKE